MALIFGPRANLAVRLSLASAALLLLMVGAGLFALPHSTYNTLVGIELDQPVPFSHQHHVAGLGIDCRYCHTSVETSPFAGMPTTETCMSCHSQLYVDAPVLAPLHASWASGEPVPWVRVHDMPDFVFFDHSVHHAVGVSCYTCHGPVEEMPIMRKTQPMFMQWCVDCHRTPHEETAESWRRWQQRPRAPLIPLVMDPPQAMAIDDRGLTDCSACHR